MTGEHAVLKENFKHLHSSCADMGHLRANLGKATFAGCWLNHLESNSETTSGLKVHSSALFLPQRTEISLVQNRGHFREILSAVVAPPARWVWGVTGLGEWAVWRYVHRPSTQPGGEGSSPYCQQCWSRPRSVAAPPPPRCKTQRRGSEPH